MSFGNLLKRFKITSKTLFRYYFIFGTSFVILLFIFYVFIYQREVSKETRIVPDLVNRFMFYSSQENFESIMIQYLLIDVIAEIEFPIIITDSDHNPVYWKNVDAPENATWDSLPDATKKSVQKRVHKIQTSGHIVPLMHPDDDSTVLAYAYYEDSRVIKLLKYLPYVEVALILFFLSFGTYALTLIRQNEQRMIWVGLAKETAHQFGTPISSIIGWLDLLKMKTDSIPQKTEIQDIIDDMTIDVGLLNKIASRFGKVGSNITLKPTDIDLVMNKLISYFAKRLPVFEHEIKISYQPQDPNISVSLDEELIVWAFENIIKNSIDAMINKSGNIDIRSYLQGSKYHLSFSDQGTGIPKHILRKIFDPGVTTKSRGWGLGLSLTKRIVEEYHHGKVRVAKSELEQGTTIEVVLEL